MEAGIPAYPVRLPITTTIKAVREKYAHLEAGEETEATWAWRAASSSRARRQALLRDPHGRRLPQLALQLSFCAFSLGKQSR